MAISKLRQHSEPTTPDFHARMMDHKVNGVRELCDDPEDAAIAITRHIHGLAKHMAAAVREREGTNFNAGERPTDFLNSEIVGAAFDAIGYLAGLANFYAVEVACGERSSEQ